MELKEEKKVLKLERLHEVNKPKRKGGLSLHKIVMFCMFLFPAMIITLGKVMGNTIPQLSMTDCHTMLIGGLLMGYNSVSRKHDRIDFTIGLLITAIPFIKILFL